MLSPFSNLLFHQTLFPFVVLYDFISVGRPSVCFSEIIISLVVDTNLKPCIEPVEVQRDSDARPFMTTVWVLLVRKMIHHMSWWCKWKEEISFSTCTWGCIVLIVQVVPIQWIWNFFCVAKSSEILSTTNPEYLITSQKNWKWSSWEVVFNICVQHLL